MIQSIAFWVFWGSIGGLVYTLVGFPLLLLLRGLLRPRRFRRRRHTPRVSVLIAAYNEAGAIVAKLDDLFRQQYPRERLEVIVASDGSSDGTDELVAAYSAGRVRLLRLPRQGKNLTLNAAAAAASGDILVFTDADTLLAPGALRRLVAPFADPSVGGVGGDFRYRGARRSGNGERSYWSLDRWLKRLQSQAGSMTSATGQLYALRRELFRPIPVGVTDDFFASTLAVGAGMRLVFEPGARAEGAIAESCGREFERKVRVIAAGLRGVWAARHLLNPARHGFYALQLLSHKVLRRLLALPLLLLLLSAPLLWQQGWLYQAVAAGNIALYSLALAGYLLRAHPLGRSRLLSLPLFFAMVNLAALVALINLLRGRRADIWATRRMSIEKLPGGAAH